LVLDYPDNTYSDGRLSLEALDLSTPAETLIKREIRPLTGLRGLAAIWVIACHWSGPELTGMARAIALHGYIAVDLFMILSGFVLAMTYADGKAYGRFIWQRLCRLYPLYALTTLVCLALDNWLGSARFGIADLLSNLLMTTTHLWEVDAIDGPSWSISVEFTLNLFFPVFVAVCATRRPGLLAGLCFLLLITVSVLNHRWDDGVTGALGTLDTRLLYLRCAPEFALGMLCWRSWRQGRRNALLGQDAVLGGILLALCAMAPFKALDLVFVLASCLLVIGLAAERGRIAAWFGSALPHWLGTISFSLYLWHAALLPFRPAVIANLPLSGGQALMVANTAGLVLLLGVSAASYHWFEVPARLWLRRQPPFFWPRTVTLS